MTLLLATISNSAMVLTADGLCRKVEAGRVWFEEGLQKIFPVTDRKLALLHHGQNIIGGRDIAAIVQEFWAEENLPCSAGVRQVAVGLGCYLDQDVRETLHQQGELCVVGFWVGGFGVVDRLPALYEVW